MNKYAALFDLHDNSLKQIRQALFIYRRRNLKITDWAQFTASSNKCPLNHYNYSSQKESKYLCERILALSMCKKKRVLYITFSIESNTRSPLVELSFQKDTYVFPNLSLLGIIFFFTNNGGYSQEQRNQKSGFKSQFCHLVCLFRQY